jgi:hypothetical protein
MIQIIRLTYHDDKDGSTSLAVKMCGSLENAKKVILTNVNTDFDGEWKSLNEAATELSNDLICCVWDENSKTFHWYDDGKGETYIICELERGETKWQNIGEIS